MAAVAGGWVVSAVFRLRGEASIDRGQEAFLGCPRVTMRLASRQERISNIVPAGSQASDDVVFLLGL